ncbi:MAG: MipA/OmpV family protein [Sideroxydans sp.]|nr:MipA/OmpV family protein [Sideroxydans sp.]
MKQVAWLFLLWPMWSDTHASAAEMFDASLRGDVGLAGYSTRAILAGTPDNLAVLPYLDCTYERFFARVDTFGYKAAPMGYGHLEVIARFNQDGFRTDIPALNGLSTRQSSLPVGLGTLQVTPLGGVFFNVFHDINESGGNWVELIYGAKFTVSGLVLYPLLGVDYQSAQYVVYYYGVSDQEAIDSRFPGYKPTSAVNAFFGLIMDIGLSQNWHLNAYLRHKRLDDAIYRSPIITQRYLDTAYLALSYRY